MVSARLLAPGGFLPEFIAPCGRLSGEGSKRLYRLVGETEVGKNLVRAPAGGQWLGRTSHSSFPSWWVLLVGSLCLRDGKGPDVVFVQLPILEGIPSVASLADGHVASAFTLGGRGLATSHPDTSFSFAVLLAEGFLLSLSRLMVPLPSPQDAW